MREIKFKAKRKDNNEWVYGYLIKNPFESYYIYQILDKRHKNWAHIPIVEVILETISQYTGLKDKNGVEIYENDIIKVKNYHYHQDKEYLIGKIVFKDGMFQINCEDGVNASIFMFQIWSESLEVIGNIYDKEVE